MTNKSSRLYEYYSSSGRPADKRAALLKQIFNGLVMEVDDINESAFAVSQQV
jgi:hypothetical protein